MEHLAVVKIRLTKNYSTYRVNDVVECDDAVAARLLADGRAVREPQMDLIETAAIEPAAETADNTPRKVQRSRHELPQSQGRHPAGS